jgi:hypothetical protein
MEEKRPALKPSQRVLLRFENAYPGEERGYANKEARLARQSIKRQVSVHSSKVGTEMPPKSSGHFTTPKAGPTDRTPGAIDKGRATGRPGNQRFCNLKSAVKSPDSFFGVLSSYD